MLVAKANRKDKAMTSYFKYSLLLTVAGCFVAVSASAKTTPITMKSNALTCKGEQCEGCKGTDCNVPPPSFTCSQKGFYDSKQTGATCKDTYILGGVHCYDCSCDENKYLVDASDCAQIGLQHDGDHCMLAPISEVGKPAVDRVEGCKCDTTSGYLSADNFYSNVTTKFLYKGYANSAKDKSGNTLTCYNTSAFECNGISKQIATSDVSNFSPNSAGEGLASVTSEPSFVRYQVAVNLKDASSAKRVICTKGVEFEEPLYTSAPTGNDCAEYTTGVASYWKNTEYFYFNGNCSTEGNCLGASSEGKYCGVTSYPAVATYNTSTKTAGSVSCYKATGCSIGKDSRVNYACLGEATSTPTNLSSFNYTDVSVGNFSCRQIKGCASGYTQVYLGEYSSQSNIDSTVANNKSNVTGTFDVQSIATTNPSTNKLATAICKKQTGCNANNGYYNVSSDSDCSWLRYFVKN